MIELCRRHGLSSATYYAWKVKFGGLEVSDAKRLRALEDKNARLKAAAGGHDDGQCGVERLAVKKMLTLAAKRKAVGHL